MKTILRKSQQAKAVPRRNVPVPGLYQAVVTAVESPEGYEIGNAIDVSYLLTDTNTGEKITYKERFYITGPINDRRQSFEALLDEIGAESYEDFIGSKLNLSLQYQVKRGKSYCNIVHRTLISPPPTVSEVADSE